MPVPAFTSLYVSFSLPCMFVLASDPCCLIEGSVFLSWWNFGGPQPNEMVCSCHLIDLQLAGLFQCCFFFMFQYVVISLSCGGICMRYVTPWPYVCGCNPHQACVTSATYTVYTLLFNFWVFFTLYLVFHSEVPFILNTKVITVSINCDHLDKDQLHNEC
jgi:hypothetical protein